MGWTFAFGVCRIKSEELGSDGMESNITYVLCTPYREYPFSHTSFHLHIRVSYLSAENWAAL
jgi:hypothetical protein